MMSFTPRAPIPEGFTTRFAPAPTGRLHLGHVVSAIWVWGLARAHAGRVLLRLEDHDRGRCRAEYERGILEDLDWLGFVSDLSAGGTAVFRAGTTPLRQSDNAARYEARLAELERAGLAYPCDCSRSGIARALGLEKPGVEPRYPGTCRGRTLDPSRTSARRIRVEPGHAESFDDLRLGPQSQDPDLQCGDFLARDRTGNYSYQFCAVVDDLEQGVDLIIRGEDILASTGRQIRLARRLGRARAPLFLHHPLVRTRDGRKLSKSAGDTGVHELRATGRTPESILGEAARLAGLHERGTPLAPEELPDLFR